MKSEFEIIQQGAKLLRKGKSNFEIEDFLIKNKIDSKEFAIYLDDIIEYAGIQQQNYNVRQKKFRLIATTILLILLTTLFILGFLGVIGIGFITVLIIFWVLQSLGILGSRKVNRRKFKRH